MRILVTGGAGFIGSHLVDAYLSEGFEVAILDNFATGLQTNINSKAKFYEVDLTDQVATQKAVAHFKPEVINHHAAHLSIYESVEDPQFDATTNIIGFLNLMEAARNNGLKKVLVASTGGALYGDTDIVPTPEEHPIKPVSPYGITKLTTEQYLHYYHVEYGIEWTAMRYSNVYGPRQNPKGETGVIAVFIALMATGKQPEIFGDGQQTRDYVFIDDVVRANLTATQKGSGPYNIGTGIETNVHQIFELVQGVLGTNFKKEFDLGRKGEQRRSALDATRARQELGWEPKVMLEEGVKRTVEWYMATA